MQISQPQPQITKPSSKNSHQSQQYQSLQPLEPPKHTIELQITNIVTNISNMYTTSKSTIKQIATNALYNVKHSACPFVNRKQIVLKQGCQPAVLLGRMYRYEDRELFMNDFHSVIWISYRYDKEDKFGDVGWGCMIRVCQMVLAQALKRCQPQKHNSQIIKQFSSSASALFSFDKICMQGKVMGRWTSSAQILIALQDLLKEQSTYKLKIQMYNSQVSIEDIEQEEHYPLLMIVNSRIAPKHIQQNMRQHLYAVLAHKCSIGMISGIGGQAIYVAGYHENQMIVLDPHYVQPESEGEKIYYNQGPRGVPLQKLVPTAGFCFLFQNAKEHKEWVHDLAQSWFYSRPYVVIECQQKFSQKVYKQRHPKKQSDADSDEFQILE